jgi:hypothetical protein
VATCMRIVQPCCAWPTCQLTSPAYVGLAAAMQKNISEVRLPITTHVLQGEVEQISLMDPQQLLGYLSEIIGTHEYEELLAEQAKKCASDTMMVEYATCP